MSSFLKKYAVDFGFEVIVANWIPMSYFGSKRISSTQIREVVMSGKVDEAYNLLGRYYQINGTVVTGRNRGGKLLGFPTANINLQDELCPKTGVYAVTAEFKGSNTMAWPISDTARHLKTKFLPLRFISLILKNIYMARIFALILFHEFAMKKNSQALKNFQSRLKMIFRLHASFYPFKND